MRDPVFDWDEADRAYERRRDAYIERCCTICHRPMVKHGPAVGLIVGDAGNGMCDLCSDVVKGAKP